MVWHWAGSSLATRIQQTRCVRHYTVKPLKPVMRADICEYLNLRTYVMTPCVASFLARYWMSEQTSIFVVKSLCQGHWVQTLYHGDMPYNCYAGLANWRAGWSQPKKDTREAGREIGRIWESIPGGFPSSRSTSRSIVCDRLFAVFYVRSPASWILMHFDAF